VGYELVGEVGLDPERKAACWRKGIMLEREGEESERVSR